MSMIPLCVSCFLICALLRGRVSSLHCTLQDLLAQHFWTSNSELELSCELCFSEHKTPQSKVVQHKDWLLLQVLRAGADDSKKVTPVEVCPSLDFADHCWDMQLVVCHLGSTASQGHYTVLKPSVSDSEDWVVYDDAVCRPANSSEIAAIPANWSLVLFRRRLQVRASAVSAEAPHEKLVVAQEQCEADLATCQEAPAAPQSMPDLPASVPDPAIILRLTVWLRFLLSLTIWACHALAVLLWSLIGVV